MKETNNKLNNKTKKKRKEDKQKWERNQTAWQIYCPLANSNDQPRHKCKKPDNERIHY